MTAGKTLCLNMIVRNEMANLERCLGALADYIDCWVIGDTGSTDGTQDFIKSFFAACKKPGELHTFPFKNFEQARNAALDCAYGSKLPYDYLLLADADMELVVEDEGFRERLEEPGYRLLQRADSGLAYWNTRLIRRNAGARYHSVTHEYIDVPGGVKELQGVWYKDHASGSNRVDKFARDIKLLSEALELDPENHRYWFYLAQSYRDAGRTAEAVKAYAKRAEMGGWDEEAWSARLQEARCLRKLGDEGGFVRQALAAFNMRPQRAEPLYDVARFYREKGMNDASVLFSEAGLAMKRPEQDILFLEDFVYTAGLQEEYSIAANYACDPARKDRGFAACNWLALNRSIPGGSRELAWSNLFFYVKPASDMLPSFAARTVGFSPPDGYRPLNPSVARLGQHIVVMQRTVNYQMTEDGLQYQTPNNAPIHTRNFLLRLTDELDIQSAAEILPPADMPEPACKLVLGFEDLRLFIWGGALWGNACLRELTSEAWCEQVLARIDDLGPATCRLTDWRVLHPEGPRVHEKNWMPQVAGDRLQFIYLCDPTRVVDDRGRTLTETIPSIAAQRFRGGSQLIGFDGGWLALIHEVQWRPSDKRRFYQHRFVWFDGANTLRRVSRPFFFHKKGVEFALGLAWHPDEKRLMISYSVADSEAWIATVNAGEVRGVLEDAEYLPSGSSARVRDAALNLPEPENPPDGTVVQTTIHGKRIRFFVTNRHDSIMKFHHEGVFYETEELDLIKRHYPRGGTFVDIGANVGNHAVYVSRFTKSSRIIVFEPNPTAISILKENLFLNHCKNVDTRFLGIALGAKKGRLRQSTPDANNLGHTCYFEDASGDIQAIDGDALILDEPVEFVKIDVEGMEIEILSGLQQTVRRWRPTIFIEVWDSRAQDFLDWCARESYHIVYRLQRYEGIWNYLIKPIFSITTENGAPRPELDTAITTLAPQDKLLVGGGIGSACNRAQSTEKTFLNLAPFLRVADSPVERRRLSRELDARIVPFLSDDGALPQIHCFYEVLSDEVEHRTLLAATTSMRAAGHPVRVWSYSPQKLGFLQPHGIEVRAAADVVPRALFERIVGSSEIRYFSDIFRYAVLYEHGGLWMDSDVILLRPFPFRGDHFLNLQWRGGHKGHFICGNVMYAEPFSRHLRALYEISIERFFAARGWEFGMVGPKLLSDYVASDAGAELRERLFSPMLFNSIDWTETDRFDRPLSELSDYLNDERVFGIHLWTARNDVHAGGEGAPLGTLLADPLASFPVLTSLADRFNTDKNRHTGNRHCYARIYDRLLADRRFSLRRLMEIGLCRGLTERNQSETPSVAMWQSYFPFCQVIGVDLTDFSRLNNERFVSFICDQSNRDDPRAVAAKLDPGSFDVIIDDGSHASFDQQLTLREFFPLLADGGWYFIEDLDWQPPGEDVAKITLTKTLLREIQQHGKAQSIDSLGVSDIAGQMAEILFFDSHYELNRAKLLGGLAAIRKRGGAGLVR
jgi:FkbM family methyltransferase